MINRVVLVGRLPRGPELQQSPSGSSVCKFSVAVDSFSKDADGNRTSKGNFFSCVCFGDKADNVYKYARKGMLVGVEGRLSQRTFQRKDGTNGSVVEILCDSVQFLSPKGAEGESAVEESPVVSQAEEQNTEKIELEDDDLPWNL